MFICINLYTTQDIQIAIHENNYLFLELYDLRVPNKICRYIRFTQKLIDMMPL